MEISRRTFLFYLGAFGATSACSSGSVLSPRTANKVGTDFGSKIWQFSPVRYPIPLPGDSYPEEVQTTFAVQDQLLVPEGYSWRVLAQWGDTFGPPESPEQQIVFGYNCDYTALIPRPGKRGEYWLCVNHEYASLRPWSQGYSEVFGRKLPELKVVANTKEIIVSKPGDALKTANSLSLSDDASESGPVAAARELSKASLEEMGVSLLHVRFDSFGELQIISDSSEHKRITTTRYLNCPSTATPRLSGAAQLFVSKVHGTACNCSGGTTPWGTFLTCEENTQDIVAEYVTPAGASFPPPPFMAEGKGEVLSLPVGWQGAGAAAEEALDSRSFGWVAEIDPETGSLVKHSALGRFRHENITLKVRVGAPLLAYMGDDRRGGHVWRFKSTASVENEQAAENSRLFEDGILSVACFASNFTGQWIPLVPETRLRIPEPETTAGGKLILPNRPEGGAVAVTSAPVGGFTVSVESYVKKIEHFVGKPFNECVLGDLVSVPKDFAGDVREFKQGVILMDAHRMANAVGGTPCARPEDLEVDPQDDGVFAAFTEASGSEDGSPDLRIFPDSTGNSSRQYGAIFKIYVNGKDETGEEKFTWQKLMASGEVAEGGSGLACADNLSIDPQGDLWVVCDITTQSMNKAVSRSGSSSPGTKGFLGLFGASSIFRFRRTESGLGHPECFAIGPVECELTGPTFTPDGKSLILSVQHPGEHNGTLGYDGRQPEMEEREYLVATASGRLASQRRMVPQGSNFPHGLKGRAPRPCVVLISKKG